MCMRALGADDRGRCITVSCLRPTPLSLPPLHHASQSAPPTAIMRASGSYLRARGRGGTLVHSHGPTRAALCRRAASVNECRHQTQRACTRAAWVAHWARPHITRALAQERRSCTGGGALSRGGAAPTSKCDVPHPTPLRTTRTRPSAPCPLHTAHSRTGS